MVLWLHNNVSILVDVDIFAGRVCLREDGSATLHIDFFLISCSIFVNGLSELMRLLLFLGDVAEAFFIVFVFKVGVRDEICFEGVGGKYFFVYIISG